MGPLLLLDKSALQALSLEEVQTLNKYYSIVIPPILLAEVQGDIVKLRPPRDGRPSEAGIEARILARKLLILLTPLAVLANRKSLMLREMLGLEDQVSLPVDNRGLESPDGQSIDIADLRARVLTEWSRGEFTNEDKLASDTWRLYAAKRIPDQLLRIGREALVGGPPPSSTYVVIRAHALLSDPARQRDLFDSCVAFAEATPEEVRAIESRWNDLGATSLRAFAPYSYFCTTVAVLFSYALASGLVGTRPSNMIDLEYLFYLPFCAAFSSGDAFHRALAMRIGSSAIYIEASLLKADLARIREYEENSAGLNDPLRPPQLPNSITCDLWERLLNPPHLEPSSLFTNEERARIDAAIALLRRKKSEIDQEG